MTNSEIRSQKSEDRRQKTEDRKSRSYGRLLFCFLFFLSSEFCFLSSDSCANNLTVSNATLTTPSATNKTVLVQFDISWDNSWRNGINYDAVWVFVKYSTDAGVTWSHATLKTSGANPVGFSQGTGTGINIIVSADKKGCFIERSAQGNGMLSSEGTASEYIRE